MSTPDGVTLDFDDAYVLLMGDEEYVSFFNSFLRNCFIDDWYDIWLIVTSVIGTLMVHKSKAIIST